MDVFLILRLRSDVLRISAFLNTVFCSSVPNSLFVEVCSASIFCIELSPPLGSVLAMHCKKKVVLFKGLQSSVILSSVQKCCHPGKLKQQ